MSFKDKTLFSFEAIKKNKAQPGNDPVVVMADKTRINKLSIVYGANASGKSNLIEAFNFIHSFWSKQPKDKNTPPTDNLFFLLDNTSCNESSEFILTFYVNEIRHIYTLIIERNQVVLEKLENIVKKKNNVIFERVNNELAFLYSYELEHILVREIEAKCLPNMSFFAAYQQVNIKIKEIDAVCTWHKRNWMPIITTNINIMGALTKYTEGLILQNNELKNKILSYIRRADFNINDFKIESNESSDTQDILLNLIKGNTVTIKNNKPFITKYNIEFTHQVINSEGKTNHYSLTDTHQSEGTLRLFGLSGVMISLLNNDAFITIDEIDASLHPKLVRFLIRDFFDSSKRSQMLLTTHYDGLLENEDLIRKDSIWFTSKKADGSTELYSVIEFKGYRKIKSLLKAYQSGVFGAIPNIMEAL